MDFVTFHIRCFAFPVDLALLYVAGDLATAGLHRAICQGAVQLSECYAQLVVDSPHPDGNDAVESVVFLNAGEVRNQTCDGLTLLVLRNRLGAPSHTVERDREDGACGFGLECITNQRKDTRVEEINWSVQNQWTFAFTEASEQREEEERVHAEWWGVQVRRATVPTRRCLFYRRPSGGPA